jgi:hypothetical protein
MGSAEIASPPYVKHQASRMSARIEDKNETTGSSACKAIIGFFDILGYDRLVERMINDSEFVKRFDTLMYGLTVDLLAKLRNLNLSTLTDNPTDDEYFKRITDTIKVRFIFDSVIFSLPVSAINFNSIEFDNKTTILNCIETFFSLVAMFLTLFTSKIGHIFRGGISMGSHYETERDNYLFIFSEAHNKAVRLEREATHPRILLEDNLRLYLEDISYTHLDKFFYKDDDECYCFDSYSILQMMDNRRDVLIDINMGLSLNMESNMSNKKELAKLIYFAKYHNRKICASGLNFPELSINIDKFVRIIEGN